MYLHWPQNKPTLLLPVQDNIEYSTIDYYINGKLFSRRNLPLASEHIDGWLCLDRSWLDDSEDIEIEVSDVLPMCKAITFSSNKENQWHHVFPMLVKECSQASCLERKLNCWYLYYNCEILGNSDKCYDMVVLKSKDLIYWQKEKVSYGCERLKGSCSVPSSHWKGDIAHSLCVKDDGCDISLCFLRDTSPHMIYDSQLSMPVTIRQGQPEFLDTVKQYRIFKKPFGISKASFSSDLEFRIAPDVWPNIRILPGEGVSSDISAKAFEVQTFLSLSGEAKVEISIAGYSLIITKQKLSCDGYAIEPKLDNKSRIMVHFIANQSFIQVIGNSEIMLVGYKTVRETDKTQVVPITENVAHCQVQQRIISGIEFKIHSGFAISEDFEVYGLRSPNWSLKASQMIANNFQYGKLAYASQHYRVFEYCVEDDNYGSHPAFALSSTSVISPQRVCEEFVWRENNLGDMVRSFNRSDIWQPSFSLKRYPLLLSGVTSIDAAYNIALDTFALNTDGRYSLAGQKNLWGSGLFQGEGQGFGVWLRDSAHIAMRCGSLIDPSHARSTLIYTIGKGFDNGNDGPAMAIVGLWDYYLATGDISALYETWDGLLKNVQAIDDRYDEVEGLVYSPTATSNDCFDEPENGGFALGGETYYMMAYESMTKISDLIGLGETDRVRWAHRANIMRKQIQSRYWNQEKGFFTSGPKGSVAYKSGLWESSGVESTVWTKFNLATKAQKRRILKNLRKEALCEYGIKLYPYKEKINHFTGSVWGVWQAGFADAAATVGDISLLNQLIYGQVRNALLNKTFYEVVDEDDGIAWRWPGQLWHAAGFISLLYYGVLGMRYDENGLKFTPAVPETLSNLKLKNLKYRGASLDICIVGAGTDHKLMLDSCTVSHIPPDLVGNHIVELIL